jgi:hypothetical protein
MAQTVRTSIIYTEVRIHRTRSCTNEHSSQTFRFAANNASQHLADSLISELWTNYYKNRNDQHTLNEHTSEQRKNNKAHEPSKAEEIYVQIQNIVLVTIYTGLCETSKHQNIKTSEPAKLQHRKKGNDQ